MTPLHLDDEALSAVVDGESTADEQAHLDACPACRERFESLRTVALAVRTPVSGRHAADVDTAILAALAMADESQDSPAAAATSVPPSPIRQRRSVPVSAGPMLFKWVLAVAAVLVVILGVGLLGRSRSSSSKASIAVRAQAGAPPTTMVSGTGPGGPVSSMAPAAPAFAAGSAAALGLDQAPLSPLGDQADAGKLAAIVDAQLRRPSPTVAGSSTTAGAAKSSTSVPPPQCVDQAVAAVGMAGTHPALRYVAPVRWQGQNATVLVFVRPDGRFAGVVMRMSDCATLTTLNL